MPVNGHKQRDVYKKWWLGKMCKTAHSREYKKVVDVITYGPPSYVYGTAVLVYEDGSEENITHRGKKPAKKDVLVLGAGVYKIKYGGHVLYVKPVHGYTSCFLYIDEELKEPATEDGEKMSVSIKDLVGKPHWPYKINPDKIELNEPYKI